MTAKRYPIEPLLAATGLTWAQIARRMNMGGPEYRRYRARGVTERVADSLATRLGLDPYQIWPEILDDSIAAAERECAAPDCSTRFIPGPRAGKKRYCSRNCNVRTLERGYYRRDPEKKKAAVRRYEAEVRALRLKRAS